MGGASITTEPNSSNSTLPLPSQKNDGQSENGKEEEEEKEEDAEEEKGECGFCLFMKAGPCGERFTAWEQCVKESEKNKDYAAAKCVEVFKTLDECMKENQAYYDFFLRAEKAELEKEEDLMRESSEHKASSIGDSTDKQEG
ncbi:hypothetical protein RchiOBHm_Chr7g0217291 [Rosa chinensis]|uniref:GCK domain-containing protein n=1 Tax=Rosa chinensis TaxID=74649 RepID=A0A2P6PBZ1_ROSCH|nr:mitochondrial intermembrane space import and assembly protein 40-like [Rosa chinensis]XP_040366631.1 mitochondrial intermembrane space import and assembly protein 40-like [Rosa chinensis]PRQ19445.1 hypothetical protein RchiOBHm_Chr7g0217291 [Rosa chinensis]